MKSSSSMYANVIKSYVKSNRFDVAIKILMYMKGSGTTPNDSCYNYIIRGLCKANRMEESRFYITELQRDGLKPKKYMYVDWWCM